MGIFRYIVAGVVTYIMLLALFTLSQLLWFNVVSHNSFFTYQSVVPTKASFVYGDQLKFDSTTVVRRETRFVWLDILRCDYNKGDGFERVSSYEDKGTVKKHGLETSRWSYQGVHPRGPATCYVDHIVTAELPYGITKTQIITGPKFEYGKR